MHFAQIPPRRQTMRLESPFEANISSLLVFGGGHNVLVTLTDDGRHLVVWNTAEQSATPPTPSRMLNVSF